MNGKCIRVQVQQHNTLLEGVTVVVMEYFNMQLGRNVKDYSVGDSLFYLVLKNNIRALRFKLCGKII